MSDLHPMIPHQHTIIAGIVLDPRNNKIWETKISIDPLYAEYSNLYAQLLKESKYKSITESKMLSKYSYEQAEALIKRLREYEQIR